MTLLANINVGSSPNDGTGDSLRTSFITCNENFQILDTLATEFTSGNLYTNVISNGSSTFNVVVVNTSITSNLFSGNGSALTNVAAVTANSATYAAQVTGNTQSNITTVGTLGNLTVAGTILTDLIEAGTIGNSGATLVGTLTTAAQPNITAVGTFTTLNFSNTNSIINNINTIKYNVLNFIGNTSVTAPNANVTFNETVPSHGAFSINANVTFNYQSISPGFTKYIFLKNEAPTTKYAFLPTILNNKGSNSIPITSNTVATFIFVAFDTTSANVVATIIND